MAKKTFTDRIKAVNPTLQFISPPEAAQAEEDLSPREYTHSTSGTRQRALQRQTEETKSRRLQVLLTPSLYDDLRERATQERISVNEMLNTILKDYLRN